MVAGCCISGLELGLEEAEYITEGMNLVFILGLKTDLEAVFDGHDQGQTLDAVQMLGELRIQGGGRLSKLGLVDLCEGVLKAHGVVAPGVDSISARAASSVRIRTDRSQALRRVKDTAVIHAEWIRGSAIPSNTTAT